MITAKRVTWERQDKGFPASQGWFTVKRQAFCADRESPVGLYLGATNGEVWMSDDEGASWDARGNDDQGRTIMQIYGIRMHWVSD